MRLLNVTTLKLEEFSGDNIPSYAILSHRWGANEVTFQDLESGWLTSWWKSWCSIPPKLMGCCLQAKRDGLSYVWIDTCCIDKRNSTELNEAINSMFAWYKNATTCYAYLPDVSSTGDHRSPQSEFRASSWFTRGWTLQELLAPKDVHFYDSKWEHIGTKNEMSAVVEEITRIPHIFLVGQTDLHEASVARRMSWAAERMTTRIEDKAYCLLGLFGVNMPMIYGEGDKAFTRLQHEIINLNSDLSIFGWSSHPGEFNFPHDTKDLQLGSYGILAPSPKVFTASWGGVDAPKEALEFSPTNIRIKINSGLLVLCAGACSQSSGCNCSSDNRKYFLSIQDDEQHKHFWGIFLEKLKPDLFVRSSPHLIRLDEATHSNAITKASRPIYITAQRPNLRRCKLFIPQAGSAEQQNYSIVFAAPQSRWHHCERGFFQEGLPKNQLWGLLCVKLSWQGDTFSTFALIRYQHQKEVHILHHQNYNRREIIIMMRDTSWDWNDVSFIFEDDLSLREGDLTRDVYKIRVKEKELWIVASIGDQLTIQVAETEPKP